MVLERSLFKQSAMSCPAPRYVLSNKKKYEHVLVAKTENFWMHFSENNK